MAEKGAHLTLTAQSKPSIFDFIAQESFNNLLHPCCKKVFEVLFPSNGRYANFSKWFEEVFLLSHSCIQYYYLKKYGATFSEKFYGLQRVSKNNSKLLNNKELWLSLVAVTLFPYLRTQLNYLADEFVFSATPQDKKLNAKQTVVYFNKGINIFYNLFKFIQHLRYVSGKTEINSPLLWFAGVRLKYIEDDPSLDAITLRNFVPQLLQRSLEIGAFFIQFLQWWQIEKSSSFTFSTPPPPPKRSKNGIKYNGICPICLKKQTIETVLSTSGFVFCFKCIVSYVQEHEKCPVTKLPATVDNLIRIYPPN